MRSPTVRYAPFSESEGWGVEVSPSMSLFKAAVSASTSAPECIVSSYTNSKRAVMRGEKRTKILGRLIMKDGGYLIFFEELHDGWIHQNPCQSESGSVGDWKGFSWYTVEEKPNPQCNQSSLETMLLELCWSQMAFLLASRIFKRHYHLQISFSSHNLKKKKN